MTPEKIDKKTLGVTPANAKVLDALATEGRFATDIEAAKFAMAHAIDRGVGTGVTEGAGTKWNVGSFDSDGALKSVIEALYPDEANPYSGIGLVTARTLAAAGAHVIVPARDRARAETALHGVSGVTVEDLDLTDPSSITEFALRVRKSIPAVHIQINSAGVMATPLFRDADGHEGQFATNHLGHYRLTSALWPLLTADNARVVTVSSRGHQIAGVDFEDIDFERRPYEKWAAYGQSKTANALFALELDRLGATHGVRAFSLHPGQILTDLARHLTAEEIAGFDATDENGQPIIDPSRGMKTVEQGAATSLWCATSAKLEGLGGVYCEDSDIAPLNDGVTGRAGVADWACDPDAAKRLWAASERMTGVGL